MGWEALHAVRCGAVQCILSLAFFMGFCLVFCFAYVISLCGIGYKGYGASMDACTCFDRFFY
jgi:hypothetical protein